MVVIDVVVGSKMVIVVAVVVVGINVAYDDEGYNDDGNDGITVDVVVKG